MWRAGDKRPPAGRVTSTRPPHAEWRCNVTVTWAGQTLSHPPVLTGTKYRDTKFKPSFDALDQAFWESVKLAGQLPPQSSSEAWSDRSSSRTLLL